MFVPRLRGRSYEEINAWLMDECIREAKRCPHPVLKDKTVWQVFEEERPFLMAYRGPFDGFHAVEAGVSKTCLVRFDNHHYSVDARAVGRPVDVRAYADRIVIRQDGETVAEHARNFQRAKITYDPWHYVPILRRKPGALQWHSDNDFRHSDKQTPALRARAGSGGLSLGLVSMSGGGSLEPLAP